MKIYIIAGEASGDIYGAKLIQSLQNKTSEKIQFYGIGGQNIISTGLKSLFKMSELSVMGFLEIVPYIPKFLNLISITADDIQKHQPDIVITIDSPGFCCRVVKKLRGQEGILEKILTKIFVRTKYNTNKLNNTKFIHYVAPTVWAYKPQRALEFAKIFDHLLTILPFEAKFFDNVGLPCTYIGHPITEINIPNDGLCFRKKYNIDQDDILITILPGSRKGEVKRLLPIFIETIRQIDTKVTIVIPATKDLKEYIESYLIDVPITYIIIDNEEEKLQSFISANAAIAKSGTVTIELAMAKCPMIIGYKVNYLTYFIIKLIVKVKYVNLINLILNKEVIPEFIQGDCKPELMSKALKNIINSHKIKIIQIKESQIALKKLSSDKSRPSDNAARAILDILK